MDSEKSIDKNILSVKDAYDQAVKGHLFFLDWRHKTFAGYITVMAALGLGFYKASQDYWFVLSLAGIFLAIAFWMFDFRNRELFYACSNAAADLEKGLNVMGIPVSGPYTNLSSKKNPPN